MILTLITIAIVLASVITIIIGNILYKKTHDADVYDIAIGGIIALMFSGVAAVIILVCIAITQTDYTRHRLLAEYEEKKAALVYQMENGFYLGDSLGEFNANIRRQQIECQNPWLSWFYNDCVMEMTPIDVSE